VKNAKVTKMTWTQKGALTNAADGTIKIFTDPVIQAKNSTRPPRSKINALAVPNATCVPRFPAPEVLWDFMAVNPESV
jgi:hypothetical protein